MERRRKELLAESEKAAKPYLDAALELEKMIYRWKLTPLGVEKGNYPSETSDYQGFGSLSHRLSADGSYSIFKASFRSPTSDRYIEKTFSAIRSTSKDARNKAECWLAKQKELIDNNEWTDRDYERARPHFDKVLALLDLELLMTYPEIQDGLGDVIPSDLSLIMRVMESLGLIERQDIKEGTGAGRAHFIKIKELES
jgi:hypothetical protein